MKDAYLPFDAQRLGFRGVLWREAGEEDVFLKGDQATEDVAVEREQGILGQVGVKVGEPRIARTSHYAACAGLGEPNDPAELPRPIAEAPERCFEVSVFGVCPDPWPETVTRQIATVTPLQKDSDLRDGIDRIRTQLDDSVQLEDLVER